MREHTITLYKFDELKPEAKERAIQKWRDGMEWDIESEFITESFEEKLKKLGYPTDNIEWRLSYSQGDGVAFYGDVDVQVVAKRILKGDDLTLFNKLIEEDLTVTVKIYKNSFGYHYSHWNTMEVELDGDCLETMMDYLYEDLDDDSDEYADKRDELESMLMNLREGISDEIKDVSRQLEKDGYADIEYYESDEAISETLKANEYEFKEDGTMFF